MAVKTTDGYLLRLFCIGFTKRQPHQIKVGHTQSASQQSRLANLANFSEDELRQIIEGTPDPGQDD